LGDAGLAFAEPARGLVVFLAGSGEVEATGAGGDAGGSSGAAAGVGSALAALGAPICDHRQCTLGVRGPASEVLAAQGKDRYSVQRVVT